MITILEKRVDFNRSEMEFMKRALDRLQINTLEWASAKLDHQEYLIRFNESVQILNLFYEYQKANLSA